MLRYVRETQPSASLNHIRQIRVRYPDDAMHLDSVTIRNLELVKPAGRIGRITRALRLIPSWEFWTAPSLPWAADCSENGCCVHW